MSFVNEYISPSDADQYHLTEIDSQFVGGNKSRDWTIDRDRNIYLRNVSMGRDEDTMHESLWTFFWKGTPLTLRLNLIGASGKPGNPGGSHWLLVRLNGTNGLPPALRDFQQDVLDDLRQALTAHKDGGVFSVKTDYTVTLELDANCIL